MDELSLRKTIASRVISYLELDHETGAGLWMEVVHDGDTGEAQDWKEAWNEARKASPNAPEFSTD